MRNSKSKIDNLKINTSEAIILLNGEKFDFRGCYTVKDIKNKIISEIIPLCRKCGFERYCKFYKKREEQCNLCIRFLNNYLESTIKLIPKKSSWHVREYLDYLLHILRLLEKFNNWQGGILDKDILKWQGEEILNLDKHWFKEINLNLAHVIAKYFFIQPSEKNFYKYKVFVEGKHDKKALERISEEINFYFFETNIEVLGGEGEIKNNLKYIKKLISEGYDIFLLMDNEGNWRKVIQKELINKKLINEKEQVLIFKKALEDAFPWEIQKQAFLELEGINDNLKQKFGDDFFKKKSKIKIIERLHKMLLPYNVNFKKDFKEQFNQNLLKLFLKKENPFKVRCELIKIIKKLIKSIQNKKETFYRNL